MNYLQETTPLFVSIKNEKFILNSSSHDYLQCIIQKAQPVRKFFRNGKLDCYSMDAKISHSGKTYCVFCDHNYICQRKIRLSMIMINCTEPIPLILDINRPSFPGFQELVERIGEDELKSTPVNLKIAYDDNDRKFLEFST